MEKQRIKSNSKSCRRLLILILLFCSASCFGQNLTYAMIKELRIVPVENQQLYTNTTIKFEVIIPYIKPTQLEISTPDDQENLSFKTIRRSENYSGQEGTKIEIWMSFKKAGTYKINPLSVRIKGFQRSIKFEPVQIMVNPQELVPELVIQFANGVEVSTEERKTSNTPVFSVNAGQKINFRINLKYAVQLVQYNWEIPTNSIFTQLKTYDITELKYRDKVYSEKLIPVADFEWIPLVPGNIEIPSFIFSATGYNGRRTDLQMPKVTVRVEKSVNDNSNSTESKYFADAFDFSDNQNNIEDDSEVTREICMRLADLREKEKLSITSAIRKERSELEKEYNLPSNQNEFSTVILFAAVILVLFFLFMLILFIRKGMLGASIIDGVFLICAVILMIVGIVKTSTKYAVSLGCKIYSIPEKTAEANTEIPAGNRVKITEQATDWYYVELGESGGWCDKNQLLVIK